MRTNVQLFDLQTKAACYVETVNLKDKSKVNRRRSGEYTTQPSSNLAKVAWELAYRAFLEEHTQTPVPQPPPTPTPTPPQPPTLGRRFAPRTHNLGNRDQDPRFCCRPEYGIQTVTHPQYGVCYMDEMGCYYDTDHMFNISNDRQRDYMVAGLNAADNMNGLEPCDPYISDTGLHLPPYPGDPILQTGSYHR